MRKVLEAVAAIAVLAMWTMTAYALYGPHPLPGQIPTHFDLAGRPSEWGPPGMLWLLPGVATLVYALMSLVARLPGSFNYPMRVTAANRPRMEHLTLRMIFWLKAEVVCLFARIQFATIRSGESARNVLSPAFVPLVLVVIFATIAVYFLALRAASRA